MVGRPESAVQLWCRRRRSPHALHLVVGKARRPAQLQGRITTSGERWSDVVEARTPNAHVLRRGEYVRVSAAALAHPAPPEKFGDRGFLHLIGAGLFVKDAKRDRDFAWELSGDLERVQLGRPIFLAEASSVDNGSGFDELEDILCGSDGPPATYR
jgi:hypothetical protein